MVFGRPTCPLTDFQGSPVLPAALDLLSPLTTAYRTVEILVEVVPGGWLTPTLKQSDIFVQGRGSPGHTRNDSNTLLQKIIARNAGELHLKLKKLVRVDGIECGRSDCNCQGED